MIRWLLNHGDYFSQLNLLLVKVCPSLRSLMRLLMEHMAMLRVKLEIEMYRLARRWDHSVAIFVCGNDVIKMNVARYIRAQ